MVNVPGRSKGCGTCRQRRVACTLEQPHCTRCVRANRECTGYKRERIFIIERGGKPIADTSNRVESSPSSSPNELVLRTRSDDQNTSIGPSTTSASVSSSLSLSLVEQAPSHSAYRQQLLAHFLSSYIPIDSWVSPTARSSDQSGIWYFLVPSLPSVPPSLSYSIVAICAAYLGRLHNNEAFIQQGLLCYGRSLKALQKDLIDARTMSKDETLAACMALATYESIECPDGNNLGWVSHIEGCARLVKFRGPEAHADGLGQRLFVAFRIMGLMEDIVHLRPTYLSDPAWMTIPWCGSPKTSIDKLVDLTSALANLLPQAITLESFKPNSMVPAGLDIMNRCWPVEASLCSFYAGLEASNQGPLYWLTPADHSAFTPDGSLTPLAFHFANLYTAYLCVLYWSTCILLWLILSQTYQILSSVPVPLGEHSHNNNDAEPLAFDGSLPPLPPSLDVKMLAQNVCQAMPYFLQDSMQGFGPALAAIPLVAVVECLKGVEGYEREVAWAREAMGRLPGRGMRLMKG